MRGQVWEPSEGFPRAVVLVPRLQVPGAFTGVAASLSVAKAYTSPFPFYVNRVILRGGKDGL